MNFKKLQGNIMDAALATAGGVGGRILTNKVMPMLPVIGKMEKFHPAATFLLGCILMDSPKLYSVGIGMSAVAGTDQAANFVPMLKYNPEVIKGIEDDEMGRRLADELEARLNADVNNPANTMNEDVNSPAAALNSDMSMDGMLGIEGEDERLNDIEGIEEEITEEM